MNKVILCGRLTKDPEVRYSQGGMAIARYTLAVDRRGKKTEGTQTADFISCTAFDKSAEFVEKYIRKGTKVIVTGRIQTGSYTDRDGKKVYTTDVVVEDHEFAESKQDRVETDDEKEDNRRRDYEKKNRAEESDFMPIPDDVDDDGLPFK